jgi:hypothetical protein
MDTGTEMKRRGRSGGTYLQRIQLRNKLFFNNNSRVVGLGRLRKKLSRSACRKQYIICQPCDREGVGDIRPKSSNVILQNFSSLQRKGLKRKLDAGAAAKKGGGRD